MTRRPTRRLLCVGLMLALAAPAGASAAAAATAGGDAAPIALLMFEEPGCPWCQRWHEEVGVGYPKAPEGQRAPLRRLKISDARALDVSLRTAVTMSPTFVLVANNREVGRITGYPGAAFFWGLLDKLLEQQDRGEY